MVSLCCCGCRKWLMLVIFTVWTVHSQWTEWSDWEYTKKGDEHDIFHGFKRWRSCSVDPPSIPLCEGTNEDYSTKVPKSTVLDVVVSLLKGKIRVGKIAYNDDEYEKHYEDCLNLAKDRMTVSALSISKKEQRCTVIEGTFQLVQLDDSETIIFHYNIKQSVWLNESLSYQVKEQQFGIMQCIEDCILNDNCYAVTFTLARRTCHFFHANFQVIQLDVTDRDLLTWMKAKSPTSPMYANRWDPSRPIEFEDIPVYDDYIDEKEYFYNQNPSQCLEKCHQDKHCVAMVYEFHNLRCATFRTKIKIFDTKNSDTLSWFKVPDAPIFQVRKEERASQTSHASVYSLNRQPFLHIFSIIFLCILCV